MRRGKRTPGIPIRLLRGSARVAWGLGFLDAIGRTSWASASCRSCVDLTKGGRFSLGSPVVWVRVWWGSGSWAGARPGGWWRRSDSSGFVAFDVPRGGCHVHPYSFLWSPATKGPSAGGVVAPDRPREPHQWEPCHRRRGRRGGLAVPPGDNRDPGRSCGDRYRSDARARRGVLLGPGPGSSWVVASTVPMTPSSVGLMIVTGSPTGTTTSTSHQATTASQTLPRISPGEEPTPSPWPPPGPFPPASPKPPATSSSSTTPPKQPDQCRA